MSSNYFDLNVQEIRRPECSYQLKVRWFTTVREVKELLHHVTKYPTVNMQLFHASSSMVLSNKITFRDLGIGHDSNCTLMLSLQYTTSDQSLVQPISNMNLDAPCKDLIRQVRSGFNSSCGPSKTDVLDCTGGVYFLRTNNGSIAAVFKPRDEEQGMPNNPKGHAGDGKVGLREHFRPGRGFVREVAAYVMDYNGFCGVPPTTIVHCEHPAFNYPRRNSLQRTYPKLGSLQKFVRSTDIFEDIGLSLISDFELQKIALLDMRILNCDRNSTNILASRKIGNLHRTRRNSRSESLTSLTEDSNDEYDLDQFLDEEPLIGSRSCDNDLYQLIPIDHGYCFPSKLMIEDIDWVWFDSPQIKKPVHQQIVEYITALDIEELIDSLTSQISIPQESLLLIRIVHYLLVEGVSMGLSLHEIAKIIARTEYGVPAALEKALADSEEIAYRAMELRNSYYCSSVSVSDVSSPRLMGKSTLVCNTTMPNTRKDTSLFSPNQSSSQLFVDGAGDSQGRVNTTTFFSSFQSNDHKFIARTVSESSGSPNSSVPSDYFMQDLDDPHSPSKREQLSLNQYQAESVPTYPLSGVPKPTKRDINEQQPFSTLEVATTEWINFDKQPKFNARDRAFSCYTSEEENDSGGESLACSPSDCSMLDFFKSGMQGMPLACVPRVVSFGAFESPSIYDVSDDKSDRQFMRLKKEKRKLLAKTSEFRDLKLKFAYEGIDKMLHKFRDRAHQS